MPVGRLGHFIRQRARVNNTEALCKSSEQSAKQTQAIAATEMNARQQTFFKIAATVKQQLGGISGTLRASGRVPVGSGRFDRGRMDEYFIQMAGGDCEILARLFLSMDCPEEGGLPELPYATDKRKRQTGSLVHTFERLCRLAQDSDVHGMIENALNQSAFGLLYRRMLRHRAPGLADNNA